MTNYKFQITKTQRADEWQDPVERGQSLFEVTVSIAISALIITAIVAIASNSIQNSSFSKDKALATSYVSEVTEWLRHERDTNLAVFTAKAIPATNYCMMTPSWTSPVGVCTSSQVISGTKFMRNVSFPVCDTCPPNVIEYTVSVSWRDSKGLHEVAGTSDLSI